MKKYAFILILLLAFQTKAQNNKRVTVELKANHFSALGNNFASDALRPFFGIGFGISKKIVKNFGLGLEYTRGYSDVKDSSIFGDLKSPRLSVFEAYLFYNHPINEKLEVDANIGTNDMRIRSQSNYRSKGYREGGAGFSFGGKVFYNIATKPQLDIVGGGKMYFYKSNVEMNNAEKEKYYSKVPFLNLNLGIRLHL
ncbi:MAG: outer membrane beta-barrel protein [Cruoricaptor ignavus]|nr:outer membrane beta-barrel protein [Cruoricaptor ignavus]